MIFETKPGMIYKLVHAFYFLKMLIRIILEVINPNGSLPLLKTYFSRNGEADAKSEVIFETKPGMIYNLERSFLFLRRWTSGATPPPPPLLILEKLQTPLIELCHTIIGL